MLFRVAASVELLAANGAKKFDKFMRFKVAAIIELLAATGAKFNKFMRFKVAASIELLVATGAKFNKFMRFNVAASIDFFSAARTVALEGMGFWGAGINLIVANFANANYFMVPITIEMVANRTRGCLMI